MNTPVVVETGWRLARRSVWHDGRPRRGMVPLALTLLLALAFGGAGSRVFQALVDARAPAAWSERVLGWTFTLTFVALVLGDLQSGLHALVAGRDLERLRASPLAPHELLALKLLQTLPGTLPPVLGIALPVACAYAWAAGGVHPLPLAAALFALWAVPLGTGHGLALALLRLAPAARVRESLAVLATFAFGAGWLANVFWMPKWMGDGERLASGFRALPAPPGWSPATWAAEAVAAPWPDSLAASAGCVLAGLAGLALAAAAAHRLLAGIHMRASEVRGRTTRSDARRASTLTGAFLRRDAALAAREWPVLLDAFASLALWLLLPLAALPLAPLPPLVLARDMLIALSVSLGLDIAARALPLERRSLVWARLSPVGGARWVWRRALGVGIVNGSLVVIATVVVGTALRLSPRAGLDVLAFGLAAGAAGSALGLLLGAALGDRAWVDPRAMLGVGGRSIAVTALLLLAAAWIVVSHGAWAAQPLPWAGLPVVPACGAALGTVLLALAARVVEAREFGSE